MFTSLRRTLGIYAFTAVCLAGQTANKAACTSKVREVLKRESLKSGLAPNSGLPAMAVEVWENGKFVIQPEVVGVVKAGSAQKVDASSSAFAVASVSKVITAAGILTAMDQGKLNVNDPVSKYLPNVPSNWKNIPLYWFLSHNSGIPLVRGHGSTAKTLDELFKQFEEKKVPLLFKPGTSAKYNNLNYSVLGAVLEKATGKPYAEAISYNVFRVGRMKNAGLVADLKDSIVYGYRVANGQPQQAAFPWFRAPRDNFDIPSGGLAASPDDLATFANLLVMHELLKPETQRLLETQTPMAPESKTKLSHFTYGGFGYALKGGTTILVKNGMSSTTASAAVVVLLPSRKAIVTVQRNVNTPSETGITPMGVEIAKACFDLSGDVAADVSDDDDSSEQPL